MTPNYSQIAQKVLDIEVEGIAHLRNHLDSNFDTFIEESKQALTKGGKLILIGVGKSGQIAQKIASTLSSTGAPSSFLHPTEALHGDLGIIQKNDFCIAFSYSGETQEVINLIPAIKRMGNKISSVTSSSSSSLAKVSDLHLEVKVTKEACPFNLAPTTTATATLAFGDALAICLMQANNFTIEEYGKLHPGGTIGNTVSLHITDIMRTGKLLARVNENAKVSDAVIQMCEATSELCIVEDKNQKLVGILTTGDLKRGVIKNKNFLEQNITKAMITTPKTVTNDVMAVSLITLFKENQINSIPVLNKSQQTVGVVDLRDLPKFKII